MTMSVISIFCFLISVIIILSCFLKGADIFSPIRVYGITWFTAIGLTDIKFSRFQHDWSMMSWIILATGLFSFLLGLFIVYVISLNREVKLPGAIRTIVRNTYVNERLFFRVIVGLSVLYGVSFLVEAFEHGELPINSARPDDSRKQFGVFGIHLFVSAMPLILFLIVQYLTLFKVSIFKKGTLLVFFIVIFVTYFSLLIRFNYIMFVLMAVCFIYYSSNWLNTRNIIVMSGAIIIMFYFTLQIREARYAENFIYVISDLKFSKTYAAFAGPYMYIVMNLENFARVVDKLDQFTMGYYSFDFLFAISGMKHQIAEYYGLQERIFLNSSFNTFPYFYPYYRDFGMMGVFLFPFILGGLIGSIHLGVRTAPNILNISLYSFSVFFIAMSFFTNPLTMLNNIFMLVLMVVIGKAIMIER